MNKDLLHIDIDADTVKTIEASTKSPREVERIKQRFFLDTVESVIYYRYKLTDCTFDAFAKNCFYICDLKDAKLINDDEENDLNAENIKHFHIANGMMKLKKRGDEI